MPWTAVVNPAAGRTTARSLDRLAAALGARGIAVRIARDLVDGQDLARAAFAAGHGVVACGGDGTVAALAAIAAETGGTLAIVPCGSGNDFARQLGLDHRHPLRNLGLLDPPEPSTTTVDLGRVTLGTTSRIFTTVANVGLDAAANRWANDHAHTFPGQHLGGTARYVLAALATIPRYRPTRLRVQVDEERWEGPAWLVAVGNSRSYGGGMLITPDASVHDGRFDVCIVEAVPRVELLRRLPGVFRGSHVRVDGVRMLRGARVEVTALDAPSTAPKRSQDLWASGEPVGPLPAVLEVCPDALRVVVPNL